MRLHCGRFRRDFLRLARRWELRALVAGATGRATGKATWAEPAQATWVEPAKTTGRADTGRATGRTVGEGRGAERKCGGRKRGAADGSGGSETSSALEAFAPARALAPTSTGTWEAL